MKYILYEVLRVNQAMAISHVLRGGQPGFALPPCVTSVIAMMVALRNGFPGLDAHLLLAACLPSRTQALSCESIRLFCLSFKSFKS